eukprot:jgi/Antlo1/124/1069
MIKCKCNLISGEGIAVAIVLILQLIFLVLLIRDSRNFGRGLKNVEA